MRNFFNWMVKPISNDEISTWFSVHNMTFEKIDLYGDIFKSLNHTIVDTYLGDMHPETKIQLSDEDNRSHFDWCWSKTIDAFKKENIIIKENGEHKDYLRSFFIDGFYNQKEILVKKSIGIFLLEIFDIGPTFSKSDLDLLTEVYKSMDKNLVKPV